MWPGTYSLWASVRCKPVRKNLASATSSLISWGHVKTYLDGGLRPQRSRMLTCLNYNHLSRMTLAKCSTMVTQHSHYSQVLFLNNCLGMDSTALLIIYVKYENHGVNRVLWFSGSIQCDDISQAVWWKPSIRSKLNQIGMFLIFQWSMFSCITDSIYSSRLHYTLATGLGQTNYGT